MNLRRGFFLQAALFILLAGSSAAAPFISDCPINVEYVDYNIITSKCKGPQYAVNSCCSAIKEFACP